MYKCITIGVSAGGTKALEKILPELPSDFAFPIVVIQHLHPNQEGFFVHYYNRICQLTVKEASEKEELKAGYLYFAPPNYHLLLEEDHTFSLNIDSKVNFARPSIDVFFETAAENYQNTLIGIILTGANSDGALGLLRIKEYGGLTIVQDPQEAEVPSMPKAAIRTVNADYILDLKGIADFLVELSNKENNKENL